MPDISKINALAIGSVAKVDGLAKASILDIDGVAVPVSAPAAAYSVRLLGSALGISSYTGDCMRVRRASDNVEADIAFDAGELKLTSGVSNTSDAQSYTDFADFVDHTGTPTDAFVRFWYDQSGNANDAEQSTAGNQPQIYDATTGLITENGKPVLQSLGGSTNLFNSSGLTSYDPLSVFAVSSINNRSILFSMGSTTLAGNIVIALNGNTSQGATGGTASMTTLYKNGTAWNPTRDNIYDDYLNTQTLTSAIDVNMNASSGTQYNLGTDEGFWHGHNLQEFIIYSVDQDTEGNRTGIETNINGFFSVYP